MDAPAAAPPHDDATLAGRRVLVTGAARGIGRAIAERFVAAGARVALLDREADALAGVAAALAMPAIACDVADPAAVAAAVAGAERALGGLDGLVNAAGIARWALLGDIAIDDWRDVLAVNLTGPFLLTQAAAPAIGRVGGGTIVNIASIGAIRPAAGIAAYAASKAGLAMFGKCMALELGPAIRVNTISPGTVETAMTADMLRDDATRARLSGNALGRLGRPADIAAAALYLTGAGSAFVNGATLVVDGGNVWH